VWLSSRCDEAVADVRGAVIELLLKRPGIVTGSDRGLGGAGVVMVLSTLDDKNVLCSPTTLDRDLPEHSFLSSKVSNCRLDGRSCMNARGTIIVRILSDFRCYKITRRTLRIST